MDRASRIDIRIARRRRLGRGSGKNTKRFVDDQRMLAERDGIPDEVKEGNRMQPAIPVKENHERTTRGGFGTKGVSEAECLAHENAKNE
ncbi:MAG: hypothetical protein LBG42_02815, partial [Treponema sp.]|nr:hypothetical protein [Treponema sp.]